jgi:hypothetical protein
LTVNSKQQTANSKQRTANSEQQTANSKQQTANSKQQTANSQQTPRFDRSLLLFVKFCETYLQNFKHRAIVKRFET